jgi:hypothetical protein
MLLREAVSHMDVYEMSFLKCEVEKAHWIEIIRYCC